MTGEFNYAITLTMIPDKDIKDNSAYYVPALQLVQAVRQYYKRRFGIDIDDKKLEKEVLRIVRTKI